MTKAEKSYLRVKKNFFFQNNYIVKERIEIIDGLPVKIA